MQILPAIKKGDTFVLTTSLNDEDGVAMTGISESLKAEVRTEEDVLVDTLVITETNIPGEYLFEADTTNWPAGKYLYTDIQYTSGDIISSSETIRLLIEKDVTRA